MNVKNAAPQTPALRVQVPNRGWRLVVDTSKPSPYDFLAVDERLQQTDARAAAKQAAAWTTQGCYAMLPWSLVVLECVDAGRVEDVDGIERWDNMEQVPAPDVAVMAHYAGRAEHHGDVTLEFGRAIREQRHSARPGEPSATVAAAKTAAGNRPRGGPPVNWGADEDELRRLANEMLGSTQELEGLSGAEKQEMLKILRENAELRSRLQRR